MRRAVITIGLGFGDCAKGATVDYLCRALKADLVVRYCGGCQAGHNVVLPDGTHHTFSQFGSGTFSGVPTYLGPEMIVSPLAMVNEANHLIEIGLSDPWSKLSVDERCLITTPYHQALNRFRELSRGSERHGSCGMGIGATREHALAYPDDTLRMRDLSFADGAVSRLARIQQWVHESAGNSITEYIEPFDVYHRLHAASAKLHIVMKMPKFKMAVFEGAQGILLDENHGYSPFTTWSTVTLLHAGQLLRGEETEVNVIGCIRPYMTRHGVGIFRSYDQGLMNRLANTDVGNPYNEWQGHLRYGMLDLNVLRYSKAALGGQLHNISLSCLDHINHKIPILDGEVKHVDYIELKQLVAEILAPIAVVGRGPCHTDRHMTELSWHPVEEAIE